MSDPRVTILLDAPAGRGHAATPIRRIAYFEAPPGTVVKETSEMHRLLVPDFAPGETVAIVERRAEARHALTLKAGDLLAVGAGSLAGLDWLAPFRGVSLHLDPEAMTLLAATKVPVAKDAALIERLRHGPSLLHDPELTGVALHLAQVLKRGGPGTALLADALSTATVAILLRNHGRDMADDPALRFFPAVAELIERRMHASPGLDEMARAAGMSRSTFTQRFRELTGTSPGAHLRAARAARARRRLSEGASPTEVALACGYADQAHLTRAFRAATGETPAAWRRRAAGASGPGG